MTQHKLIIEYIAEFGYIIPATLSERQRAYKDEWIGITAIRRCEELVEHTLPAVEKYPLLYRWPSVGKFARFGLTPYQTQETAPQAPKTCCPSFTYFNLHARDCKTWEKEIAKLF